MITALRTPVRASKAEEKVNAANKSIDDNLVKDKIDAKIMIDTDMANPKLSSVSDFS